ncbi:hypothetical protein [Rhizobium calliandrae]|uniref:hypothetical protein n=1 Tax=Rhizobium calliandrae TaxID=1312182 RepID=UPI0025599AF4|nr:hypothetical protein [Rhizobium calliandrae]
MPSPRKAAGTRADCTLLSAEQRIEGRKGRDLHIGKVRLPSLVILRDTILASAGAALLAKFVAADDIEVGRPAYWGTHASPLVEIWALQSSRRLIGAKARAFLDVIEKAFPEKILIPPT